MKNIIKNKTGLNVLMEQKNTEMKSKIFCDRIEYVHDRQRFEGKSVLDHHLMFYLGKELVFKVWLKQNKKYKNIKEALKDVGILVSESWDVIMAKKLKKIKGLKHERINFELENPPIRFRKNGVIDLLHPQEGVTNEEVADLW